MYQTRPRGYKAYFVLNSAEHEVSITHKYQIFKNIAKSEQSSHIPGGSHQRPYHFNWKEKWTNKGTNKQYVVEYLIHSTTCHI